MHNEAGEQRVFVQGSKTYPQLHDGVLSCGPAGVDASAVGLWETAMVR